MFSTMNEDTLENSQIPMTVQRYRLYVSGDWGVKAGQVRSWPEFVVQKSVDIMAYHRPSKGIEAKLSPLVELNAALEARKWTALESGSPGECRPRT